MGRAKSTLSFLGMCAIFFVAIQLSFTAYDSKKKKKTTSALLGTAYPAGTMN